MAIFLFARWRSAAILDFDTGQMWRYGTLRTVHIYRLAKFGDNISNGGRVITIFRFSKWRPAAILDFILAQKWHHSTLRAVHGYQLTNFGEDVSNSGWVMVIFLFSTWRPAAILDFDTGQKWRYCTLRTVNVYHRPKFCNCTSTGGWVIAFCGKIQNGGVRHFEFVFGNSGPSTKFACGPEATQKIWCQSSFYFSRYRDFKILKIWLKTPIQAPKIYVFGGF